MASARGVLVLSDFGLSKLNDKNTHTNIKNDNVLYTLSYAPTEIILTDQFISRSTDIWALGYVFLEFATWLMHGGEGIKRFQQERTTPFLDRRVQNDIFWTVSTAEDSNGQRVHGYSI